MGSVTECPVAGCLFYAEFPGDLAQHEVVHNPDFGREATAAERDALCHFAQQMLGRLKTARDERDSESSDRLSELIREAA